MPTRVTPIFRRAAASRRQPCGVLATCQHSVRPCTAISSLAFEVSIPAVNVLICVIFVVPALQANLSFRQPSGSDEDADDDHATDSHKRLRAQSIRSPAALPRMAVRGRAFLSEQPQNNRSRYYKAQ